MRGPLISPWRWIALALLLPAAVGAQVAFEDVYATAQRESITLRDAATMLAVSRVAEATLVRGIYP